MDYHEDLFTIELDFISYWWYWWWNCKKPHCEQLFQQCSQVIRLNWFILIFGRIHNRLMNIVMEFILAHLREELDTAHRSPQHHGSIRPRHPWFQRNEPCCSLSSKIDQTADHSGSKEGRNPLRWNS
ncbi:hypothetical protein H2248_003151 [Termitomyces sp. 'cryptogamus']|nr:hypothetical protein H2248_003151 [Termitomyces sp. 'cryptogamus']